jgi:hypothetical protein
VSANWSPPQFARSCLVYFPGEISINETGFRLQKDLGKTTKETATATTKFDPDAGWDAVEQ